MSNTIGFSTGRSIILLVCNAFGVYRVVTAAATASGKHTASVSSRDYFPLTEGVGPGPGHRIDVALGIIKMTETL